MKNFMKILTGAFALMMLIGACLLDSAEMTLPVALTVAGGLGTFGTYFFYWKERMI